MRANRNREETTHVIGLVVADGDHRNEADFLVRLATPRGTPDLTLVLEVKGFEDNKTTAKHEGAQRWVRAVNNWGKLGRWAFHVCRNPQTLELELAYLVREQAGRTQDASVVGPVSVEA